MWQSDAARRRHHDKIGAVIDGGIGDRLRRTSGSNLDGDAIGGTMQRRRQGRQLGAALVVQLVLSIGRLQVPAHPLGEGLFQHVDKMYRGVEPSRERTGIGGSADRGRPEVRR